MIVFGCYDYDYDCVWLLIDLFAGFDIKSKVWLRYRIRLSVYFVSVGLKLAYMCLSDYL